MTYVPQYKQDCKADGALKKMLKKPNATVIYGSETIRRNHFTDSTSFPIDSHNLTSHKSADWW